jgi:hypothetical protein
MKNLKTLLSIIALLSLTTLHAQWEDQFMTDDFGDPTDEKFRSMINYGTFSNSATTNSKAMYGIVDNYDYLAIMVFEYGDSPARSIEDTFETVLMKKPDGTVITYKNVVFSTTGTLIFKKRKNEEKSLYHRFLKDITDSGTYAIAFKKSGTYGSSSYDFKFDMD